MNTEKWKNLLGDVKENFQVEDEGKEHLEEEGGVDIEYIVFQGPLGKIRLEYIIKPVILDKKTIYSRRIGSETKVDYIYSQEEKSCKLVVYKWEDEDWVEIDGGMFDSFGK